MSHDEVGRKHKLSTILLKKKERKKERKKELLERTPKIIRMVLKVSRRQHRPLWWCMAYHLGSKRSNTIIVSLISTNWRFFVDFCNYQLGKVLFHHVCLFSLYPIQSYLLWFAEFADKLIDTTASRLARHFVRNEEKMAWSFVLSGYVRRVAKGHSTCLRLLLKSDRHR